MGSNVQGLESSACHWWDSIFSFFCTCPPRNPPTHMPVSCLLLSCMSCSCRGSLVCQRCCGADHAFSNHFHNTRQPRPTPAAPPPSSPLSSPSACKPSCSLVPEALLGRERTLIGPCSLHMGLVFCQTPCAFSHVALSMTDIGDGRKLSLWCLVQYLGQGPWLATCNRSFLPGKIHQKTQPLGIQSLETLFHDSITTRPAWPTKMRPLLSTAIPLQPSDQSLSQFKRHPPRGNRIIPNLNPKP